MASGVLIDQYGQSIPVNSNSCADVKTGYNAFFSSGQATAVSCSADPVVAGTAISFQYPNGGGITLSVSSMSATNSDPGTSSVTCTGACTVTLQHEFNIPPLTLSTSEGAQIALAVIAVWVVGFAVRMVLRSLDIGFSSNEKDPD